MQLATVRTFDLSDAELKKVVMRFPALLGYSVEDNMAPKLDWLQERLELDAAQLKKMVLNLPQLLALKRREQHGAEARLATDAPRSGRRAVEEDWF